MKTVAIGCDPNATELKNLLIGAMREWSWEVTDFGSPDPIYAKTAIAVATAVAAGKFDRGVLLCGTGIGMSIAANKVRGAYAALIPDVYSAQRAQLSNDANIACFGAFTQGSSVVKELLRTWLEVTYQAGTSSEPKVACYRKYDEATRNLVS